MSLKGSLETVGLTDVLTLLAMTKKTGELQVTGPRSDGRLWVNEGQLIGSKAGRGPSHVDAIFELLRVKAGTFDFEDGEAPPEPGPATDIAPLLIEATARLSQWDDIEASIPSLAFTVAMAPTAPMEEVTIRADQWRLLAAAGGGQPVSAVLDVMEFGEFDGCQALKELADANLITVVEPTVEEPKADIEPIAVEEPKAEVIPAVVMETVPEPVSDQVELPPIGPYGDPRLAPIHSHAESSYDSERFSDFGPGPSQASEGIDLSPVGADAPAGHVSEPDASSIDVHPFETAFGEMASVEGNQSGGGDPPDASAEEGQGDQSDLGHQVDHGYELLSAYRPNADYQPWHAPEAGDAPAHEEASYGGPQDVGSSESPDGNQSHQPYQADQSEQAPLDYQAGHGYQTQPSDHGYSANQGYQTYRDDRAEETEPTSFADPGQVVGTPSTTDAVAPLTEAAAEAAAAPDGDAKVTPADEPINRGLLLKFLSSVRT